ncbi:YicC family protein [bacterium]|nr:YicC family protein [bacterium]
MTRSMTGFGTGIATDSGLSITVEIRGVNNRFLDVNLRLPRALYSHDPEIRDLVHKRIQRGRISLYVNEEFTDDQVPDIRLDKSRAVGYARELKLLIEDLGLKEELRLEHLLTIDDLVISADNESYHERVWQLFKEALDQALDQFISASVREGETLRKDILERTEAIGEQLEIIGTAADKQVVNYHEKLTIRLSEMLDDNRLDRNRLETEIALAADRLDISEEIVRLNSHLKMFSETLGRKKPVGKTLNFTLQEMSRETNTIASKSPVMDISQAAIKIKELLEQIREQVQNIE